MERSSGAAQYELAEILVKVSDDPPVELFVAQPTFAAAADRL